MNLEINKLTVLWTSDNLEIATNMLLMYLVKSNTNKWWKECNLITWGPSNKLLCENTQLQEIIKELKELGVHVYACKRCADIYGIADKLEALGIEVKYMGEPLTEYLKDNACRVLTI